MLVGYCRVSIVDDRQTTDLQQDALLNVGIDKRNIYEDRASGAKDNGVYGTIIKVWATDYTEIVNCNQLIDVTLQGGFDSGYANQVGTTVIHGRLNISQGKVIANGIAIR